MAEKDKNKAGPKRPGSPTVKKVFSTGDEYEGEIANGMKHGKGTFIFAVGGKYVG
jgi:hypothetical protein